MAVTMSGIHALHGLDRESRQQLNMCKQKDGDSTS